MKHIWSRCVGFITSAAGPPPTDQSSASTSTDEVVAMIKTMYPDIELVSVSRAETTKSWVMWSVRLRWWGIKHLMGIHSPVPVEEWNSEQGSVRFVGDRCWICDAPC